MRTSNIRIAAIGSAGVALCLTVAIMQTSVALAQQPGSKGKGGVATITPDPRVQQKTYHFDSGDPATSKDLSFVLFVSSKVKKDEKAPLIVALHGLGGDGNFLVREKMIDLAEEQGYIVVGPLGYELPNQAFRRVVRFDLYRARDEFIDANRDFNGMVTCAESGKRIAPADAHMDHRAPMTFEVLVTTFLVGVGLPVDEVPIASGTDEQVSPEITDWALADAFRRYHAKLALLDLVEKGIHLSEASRHRIRATRITLKPETNLTKEPPA